MIVVDASALVDLLLGVSGTDALRERLLDSAQTLHAPHLVDIEVAHALRRLNLLEKIDDVRARIALIGLSMLPLQRHPHAILLVRIWHLRRNLTGYDAAYVALAEILDAPLVTRDRRLAATTGHRASIEAL